MLRTYAFISSFLLCVISFSGFAQKSEKKTTTENAIILNSVTIHGDIASIAGSALSNGETYSYEAGIQADVKHEFYPVFELGFAGANKISTDNINFSTNAIFGRIGVDVNLLKPKKDEKPTNNLLLAGFRLGMSSFPYSISNVQISDNYWNETQTIGFENVSSTKIWYEIVLGLKVEITKNIFMGWSVRSKNMLSQDITGNPSPWFIPGFGTNTGSNWGFNYTLGYKIEMPTFKKIVKKGNQ